MTLYDMYTATGVSHYRENRYGHHYRGLHYGVLDIQAQEKDTTKVKANISVVTP